MLENKHILITGANRGIGKATAELAVACGAQVYLAGRDEESLEALAQELGEQAIPFCYDLTDPEQIKSAFSHIQSHVGQLDGLVNNAGMMLDAPIAMTRESDFDEMFNINTKSPFLHAQLSSRLMARNKSGSIVNLCSVVGERGSAGQSAYSMSKAAMTAMTKSLSKELGPVGVRVNGVAPGFIATDMVAGYQGDKLVSVLSDIPLGRPGQAHDVANTIIFLLSDHTAYVTGQIWGVDGGMRM